MTHPWTRRSLLLTAGGASLAAGLTGASALARPHTADGAAAGRSAASAEDFAALRTTWRELLLGTGFSPTAQPFKDRLAALGATARKLRSTMAPADGSLWPDAVFADPEPDTDPESYGFSGPDPDQLRAPADDGAGLRAARHGRHRRPGPRHRPADRPGPPRRAGLQRADHPLRQLVQLADRRPAAAVGHLRPAPRPAVRRAQGTLPRRGRPLRTGYGRRLVHGHQHRSQPRGPVPGAGTARHRRGGRGQDRAGPRRPHPGIPLRHLGRRHLRRRLGRPAHLRCPTPAPTARC